MFVCVAKGGRGGGFFRSMQRGSIEMCCAKVKQMFEESKGGQAHTYQNCDAQCVRDLKHVLKHLLFVIFAIYFASHLGLY